MQWAKDRWPLFERLRKGQPSLSSSATFCSSPATVLLDVGLPAFADYARASARPAGALRADETSRSSDVDASGAFERIGSGPEDGGRYASAGEGCVAVGGPEYPVSGFSFSGECSPAPELISSHRAYPEHALTLQAWSSLVQRPCSRVQTAR